MPPLNKFLVPELYGVSINDKNRTPVDSSHLRRAE